MRKCPNLTSIVGTKLGTKGAMLLSQHISFGDTNMLRSISLSWNSINTYDLNLLIPSLAQNCHALEFSDLKGNSITSDGINCIKQAFKSKLDLSLNPIGSKGVFAILKTLFQELLPYSFKLLLVRGCKIDESDEKMERELGILRRLGYNLADDEDDNKPERVEDVESILVARIKKIENTLMKSSKPKLSSKLSYLELNVYIIQYAVTKKVIFCTKLCMCRSKHLIFTKY